VCSKQRDSCWVHLSHTYACDISLLDACCYLQLAARSNSTGRPALIIRAIAGLRAADERCVFVGPKHLLTACLLCAVLSRAKKRSGAGFGSVLSEPMQKFLGVESMARPQVVKAIWAYIKENNLQVCGTTHWLHGQGRPGHGHDKTVGVGIWVCER